MCETCMLEEVYRILLDSLMQEVFEFIFREYVKQNIMFVVEIYNSF